MLSGKFMRYNKGDIDITVESFYLPTTTYLWTGCMLTLRRLISALTISETETESRN